MVYLIQTLFCGCPSDLVLTLRVVFNLVFVLNGLTTVGRKKFGILVSSRGEIPVFTWDFTLECRFRLISHIIKRELLNSFDIDLDWFNFSYHRKRPRQR